MKCSDDGFVVAEFDFHADVDSKPNNEIELMVKKPSRVNHILWS